MSDRIELIMDLKAVNFARALCRAVEPDNRTAPAGITITTHQERTRLITVIESTQRLQTLLATFNDLIEALTTVLNVLRAL
ncbi:MAG: KEOPS complex subunit Pcc1 [Candidatus Heimdallarchaeota archaeon]